MRFVLSGPGDSAKDLDGNVSNGEVLKVVNKHCDCGVAYNALQVRVLPSPH